MVKGSSIDRAVFLHRKCRHVGDVQQERRRSRTLRPLSVPVEQRHRLPHDRTVDRNPAAQRESSHPDPFKTWQTQYQVHTTYSSVSLRCVPGSWKEVAGTITNILMAFCKCFVIFSCCQCSGILSYTNGKQSFGFVDLKYAQTPADVSVSHS